MNQSVDFKLILEEGTNPPREFELTRPEIIIGRDPNVDLTIPSPAVSRRHARLIRQGEGYLLEDLGSSNGTYLNGERLLEQRELKTGDQIRFGQAVTIMYEAPVVDQKTVVSRAPAMPAGVLQTELEQSINIEELEAAPPETDRFDCRGQFPNVQPDAPGPDNWPGRGERHRNPFTDCFKPACPSGTGGWRLQTDGGAPGQEPGVCRRPTVGWVARSTSR